LFNTDAGDHFYTTNENEKAAAMSSGWVDESDQHPLFVFVGNVPTQELASDGVVLRRFWIPSVTDHFYSTKDHDSQNALSEGGTDETWKEQGEGQVDLKGARPGIGVLKNPLLAHCPPGCENIR
jgi:hypothetical protein